MANSLKVGDAVVIPWGIAEVRAGGRAVRPAATVGSPASVASHTVWVRVLDGTSNRVDRAIADRDTHRAAGSPVARSELQPEGLRTAVTGQDVVRNPKASPRCEREATRGRKPFLPGWPVVAGGERPRR